MVQLGDENRQSIVPAVEIDGAPDRFEHWADQVTNPRQRALLHRIAVVLKRDR